MAAAPLESSSTPPGAISTDPTRPKNDPMEDSDPQTTRKRPRLDSGSGACESLSTDETSASRTSDSTAAAPAAPDQEASVSTRPASRVTINMKSPTSVDMTAESVDSTSPEQLGAEPAAQSTDPDDAHAPNVISLSSSPAQSPEIEVAELEDMDQEPDVSNWRTLGEALRDPVTPDVVQLHDQLLLTETFPKINENLDLRENVEEIWTIIEKGPPHDVTVFLAMKNWLEDSVSSLNQLTYEVWIDDRDFWDEIPIMLECLLRRVQDFQPDEGRGPWDCFEEFFLSYARLTLHMVRSDTLALSQLIEDPDTQAPELMSRAYLPSLAWILQIGNIPFFRTMEKVHGSELANLITRLNDQIAAPPFDVIPQLSEYTVCIMALISRWPQLSSPLTHIMNIAHNMVESGNERRKHHADDALINSPVYIRTMKAAYNLVRAVDEKYQVHITKKWPYVTNDTGELMLRNISSTYSAVCQRDPALTLQLSEDLSIDLPDDAASDEYPSIIYYGWRFSVLKKHIMDGRMELRVHGMETMQTDLVQVWRQHIQNNPRGIEHAVVQYLVRFLRDNKIVDYIVGIDSHPQLISRSGNIVGFLVVTSTYTDADTDTIWETVTQSQDPRTVSEVLGMLTKTFPMHMPGSPSLLYLCSKLLDLPLNRFDARMVDFCEQLLYHVREKHERVRHDTLDIVHVDAIPLQLCVRLIRESAAFDEFSVEHKAILQRFASSQLSQFIRVGLSEAEKMDTYERCIQDIAEMNQFTVGSIQALNALCPTHDIQEIRKLATEFDLTHLVIAEIAHAVDLKQTDFTDSFSRTGLMTRVHILARIIDKVPDTITEDLSDVLWRKIFMSKELVEHGRRTLWDMLCTLTSNSMKRNPFIERCIQEYLPELLPEEYSPEVLSLAKQAIAYEVRFNPPPTAGEKEVVSVPGMDRIWSFILTAPPGSIETDAANFAIEVYLDHNVITRSPRSAVEATHIALVDRCVDQLKSAAIKLKLPKEPAVNGQKEPRKLAAEGEMHAEELRFSRSLLFLRQFLQGLRTRPQYSPPQGPPPDLPRRPIKGEPIDISYQAFNGGLHSKVSTMRIGDLSTASNLVDRLVQLTGFSKFKTIYGGRRIDLLEKPESTLRDLKIRSGLLIIRKDADSHEVSLAGRRQSLTLVDSEVLKHFDDLYDLLGLEDHLAREIYDFLVVFPPQERVLQLVKSDDKTDQDIFPIEKPYSFLYSVNALSVCLRDQALEASTNDGFVSHSVVVLNAALTRPEMSELANNPTKILFATNLVECLLFALLVKPPVAESASILSDPAPLVRQLVYFIEVGQQLPSTYLPQSGVHKLICNSFAVLTEGSLRDHKFWDVIKQHAQLDRLIFSLLLEENRQAIRKEIAENIAVACSPSKLLKKSGKPGQEELQGPPALENPTRIGILATIWDAFVQTLPQTLDYAQQSQEFFQVAMLVFQSVAEKSPRDLIFGEYLRQWSGIMLSHRTEEFVGREPVDHLILGFSRLLRSCLDLANSTNASIDTFNLTESLFDSYLFPNLSMPSDTPIVPQIPVMHAQTRQELYAILSLLCKDERNYMKVVENLEDIIPADYTYSPTWCFDRYKMIRSPEGYAGLKNLSNTCYLNSLLTQLFMNVGFRDFMLQLQITDAQSAQRLLGETKKLFGYMQETWLKSVDPQGLVDTIRTYDNEPIDVTIQMDVDEFYNLLFDRWEAQIHDAENKRRFRSFYGGQLVQQIKSKECPHISERLEPFSAIQCDIKGKASLEESLQAYVEGEIMQGDNKYSCTSCGRHVDAVKRACLKEVPDNLIFHLKRFDFDMVTMMRNKINDEFQFPEHIDMSPFKVEYLSEQDTEVPQDVFELVGVLVHSGTAESGHYYSYIRERPTTGSRGSWVEFNDSDVSRFDPSKIADQCFGGYNDSVHPGSMGQVRFNKVWNAYMLFYQRVSSMDSAKSIYRPTRNNIPVRVPLPLSLENHITMENEVFIRTYCLLDPYHALFIRYLLCRLPETMHLENGGKPKLDKPVIFIALDTLEQLISRCREPLGLDVIVSELFKAINESPKGAHRVLQWTLERPTGIRNLALKSPHASVRNSSIRIIVAALVKLQELRNNADLDNLERERWQIRYLDAFESTVATLEGLWSTIHTVSRSWDDYFEFLLMLATFGPYEAGVLLNNGFLLKCLEIVWLDREDTKKLKRQYVAYSKLVEKGRRFSHKKLMDVLFILLSNIDLRVAPTSDDERQALSDGKYSLTAAESTFIRPLGKNQELAFLKKLLQQYSSPQACKNMMGLLLDAEPEAGLMDAICKVLEDGLRVAPAELCTAFLDATLIFCRRSPDENRILALIDFVAKGVESINNSGGKEHLAFFTNAMSLRNERLGLNENWFLSHVIEKIPDWAPTLLIYPDKAIRNMTLEVLRQILFSGTTDELIDDWQSRLGGAAKELVHASVDKLRRTYLAVPGHNVEARVVETIKTVIDHCLVAYFGDSEEDQEFVRQAHAVSTAIDELSVDLPEELASEDWEDNSMMASDSEMGLAGSP
ncbi:hypothetical protein AWENTII_006465 [Aspergillus wentii]